MKRFLSSLFLFIATILPCTIHTGAQRVGEWDILAAYHEAGQTAPGHTAIYALYDGNLLAYDPATTEVTLLNKMHGLSGPKIAHIVWCDEARTLVIVYDDLFIDLLDEMSGEVTHLPQLRDKNDGTRTLNSLSVCGGDVVLALSDGVAHIDVAQALVRGSYTLGTAVTAATIYQNRIYAATSQGIVSGLLSANLFDPTQWPTVMPDVKVPLLASWHDGLYVAVEEGTVKGLLLYHAASDGTLTLVNHISQRVPLHAVPQGQTRLTLTDASRLMIVDGSAPDRFASLHALPAQCTSIAPTADGTLWAACGTRGLRAYKDKADNAVLTDTGIEIGGYGPRRDLCYYLRWDDTRLMVGGGRLDPYDRQHYAGTIMTLADDQWTIFQEDSIVQQTKVAYRDVTCVATDPTDPEHVYATTGGTGLYEFRNGRFVRQYSVNNSPLRSASKVNPYYVRTDGLSYDEMGNLWMVNNGTDTTLRVLRTDGTWRKYYVEELKKAPTLEKTLFDSKGRLWVCSRRTTVDINHTAGLLCIDFGSNKSSSSDDVVRYRTSVTNQDGTVFDLSTGVFDIMECPDGSLWVGTASGLLVIDDPDNWAAASFRATQIKVPRNDGTNYADYLLAGVPISAMACDGAGRKWVGTMGNGLYLVSADGLEVVHHFMAGETPLLSDVIYDLAINPQTGTVYIGTDRGLCAYGGDATEAEQTLSTDHVRVYPNPVRPEYRGNITISGLTEGADVKITAADGRLVRTGTSLGGTFIWDGRTATGHRVPTGVYLIMVSTADGQNGIVAKVTVI